MVRCINQRFGEYIAAGDLVILALETGAQKTHATVRMHLVLKLLNHHNSAMSHNLRRLLLDARVQPLRSIRCSYTHSTVRRSNFHSNARNSQPQPSAVSNNDVPRFYSMTANSKDDTDPPSKRNFSFHVSASFSPKNKVFRPAVDIYEFDDDLSGQRKRQEEAGQDSWFVANIASDPAKGVALGVVSRRPNSYF